MNIVAYIALHYGRTYLGEAILSIIEHVDKLYVLYSATPSHGQGTDLICPETEQELYDIARRYAGDKLVWHKGQWMHEGYQRDTILELAKNADAIIRLDSDEIWPEETIIEVIKRINEMDVIPMHRYIRIPFIHFWRSFYYAVIDDASYPVIVTFLKAADGETTWSDLKPICHMGYAQPADITYYKQYIHGHRNDWRWDEDWYNTVWLVNRKTDCHPTNKDFWNAVPVNPLKYMPRWMKYHKFANTEVIE